MINLAFKGIEKAGRNLEKWADQKEKQLRRAMSTALATVGYKVMSTAKQDIKHGDLDIAPKAIYRNEPGDPKYRTSKSDKYPPFSSSGMLRGITYNVDRRDLNVDIGYLGLSSGTAWQAAIAEKSLHGYKIPIRETYREKAHKYGIHMRTLTTEVDVPARDVMGAVLSRMGEQVLLHDLHKNFEKQMKGSTG